MRKLATLSFISASLLLNTFAYAENQNQHWNQHAGFYVEGNVGTNWSYADFLFSDGISLSEEGLSGLGWNAALGYNFNPRWALEAGFIQSFAEFELNDGSTKYTHANLPYIVAAYTLPIHHQFSFLFKFGVMYVAGKGVGLSNELYPDFGLGMAYAITPKLDITLQMQGYVLGIFGFGLLSTGLTYHFS